MHLYRRTLLMGGTALLAAAASSSARQAQARPAPVEPQDERFMQMAIDEATAAAVGFGGVIVKDGVVLARGANRTAVDRDPTAHGEMVAIRRALAAHGPEPLVGATVYTTGEPCCMCMGAIMWCGFGRVVYAASLADIEAKYGQIGLSAEDVAIKTPFAQIAITGGVLRDAAVALFK